jgi:regulator of protease activity HflC (stomatin/prohibitin superfamily)
MRKVSLRTVTMPIPAQQVITKDSVSIGLAAVAYFRRVDPVKSIVEVENVESAITQIARRRSVMSWAVPAWTRRTRESP